MKTLRSERGCGRRPQSYIGKRDGIVETLTSKKKRLLVVANVSKEHIRKFHIPFICHMKARGWTVDVACRLDAPIPECDTAYDLPCDRNPFRGSNKKSIKLLKAIMKENEYDAVICNTLSGGLIARAAVKALGKDAPLLIYISHGLHFFKGAPLSRWLIGYPFEKMLTPWTDVLVTINEADYQMAKERLKPKAIERIHGIGVDLARFRSCSVSEEDAAALRQSLGIGDNDFVLTYVAEINENKNQPMLVKAFSIVRQAIPNAKLLLIGPEHDGGKLEDVVRNSSLNGSVIFAGWRDDIPRLLKASDLYVASSKSEGLPLNLIEAMACDLPVVASINRGHGEIIDHGKNGFLVKQDDAAAMAEHVIRLYKDPELRQSIIRQAQSDISKFELENVIKEEESILDRYVK